MPYYTVSLFMQQQLSWSSLRGQTVQRSDTLATCRTLRASVSIATCWSSGSTIRERLKNYDLLGRACSLFSLKPTWQHGTVFGEYQTQRVSTNIPTVKLGDEGVITCSCTCTRMRPSAWQVKLRFYSRKTERKGWRCCSQSQDFNPTELSLMKPDTKLTAAYFSLLPLKVLLRALWFCFSKYKWHRVICHVLLFIWGCIDLILSTRYFIMSWYVKTFPLNWVHFVTDCSIQRRW